MQAANATAAVDLATALAPAFAAGMAVQRLIEIVDYPLTKVIGEENKKGGLGLLSLFVGLCLSYGLGLRVLIHLGVTDSTLVAILDRFVAGLIVSAGTEGFNSILKFVGYKKAEVEAKAKTEKLWAADTLSLGGRLKTLDVRLDVTPRKPEDVYKEKLQNQVRRLKADPNLVVDFKNDKLSKHASDETEAQVVVLQACEDSAEAFGKVLNSKGRKTVRDSIRHDTSYSSAIGVMRTAVSEGAEFKTEENLA